MSLDIEGDGNKNQRPLEISLCEFDGGVFTREWHWLVNPGRKISYFATKKHGIRDRDVGKAPKFGEISAQIAEVLKGRTCVAHDATGDLLMLGEGDVRLLDAPALILCTYRMAKTAIPQGQPVSPGVVSLSSWLEIG